MILDILSHESEHLQPLQNFLFQKKERFGNDHHHSQS